MGDSTTQVFDDGSSVTYDANDVVTAVTNSAGQAQYVPPADGSATMQQFSALFSQGVQAVTSVVTTKLKGSLASSPTPGAPTAANPTLASLQKYLPMALLIGGGFFLAKKFL